MRSVVEPVQLGRALPAIVKLFVSIHPEPFEFCKIPVANGLQLAHGASDWNGRRRSMKALRRQPTTSIQLTSPMGTRAWRSLSPHMIWRGAGVSEKIL